jgi:RNA polymerase sigma factor (sigma-70 family)
MLRTQSDARLVDLVRAGHASAFEAIVQRYRKPLLGYCSRLLPASRAEDAVQQTFLKAYQAMVSGDAELNLRPWLYRIAHNASLNLLRQNGWSHEELDENFDGVQRPDQALELRERLREMVAAVNALPERQRDAMLLREIDGLSYEEIAEAMGVGDGAVRQLLHRARATLRAGMTAVTPVGLLERLATALAGGSGDPSARVAEMAAGFGLGAGAMKVGAAVLATGAIATGVATVPLVRHHTHPRPGQAQAADAAAAAAQSSSGGHPSASSPSHSVQVDDRSGPTRRPSKRHRHRGDSVERHGSSLRSGSGGGRDGNSGSTGQPQHRDGGGTSGPRHSGMDGSGGGSSGDGGSGGSGGGPINVTGDGGGSDHSGSDDGMAVPTGPTVISGPVIEQSGKDGGGSSGSGSGDGSTSTSTSGSDGSGSTSGGD